MSLVQHRAQGGKHLKYLPWSRIDFAVRMDLYAATAISH